MTEAGRIPTRAARPRTLRCGAHTLSLDRTLVMGVLNVTPDSFSDGGLFVDPGAALRHAEVMVAGGADIVDVGGESTAPGTEPVPAGEEMDRVLSVVSAVARLGTVVSIDSYKPEVVRACLEAGATLINDITGAENPRMAELAREFDVPLVVMHMQGRPGTMQADPQYVDVIGEISEFFRSRLERLEGIQVILDPGIGFGKTLAHNLEILRRLEVFKQLGVPLLVGASRKRFIGALTDTRPSDRVGGSIAAHTVAALNGADIVRAHEVVETRRAMQIVDAILEQGVEEVR